MTPNFIVYDTNILFSGTGWRGSPYHCLQLARRGEVTLLTCREILVEFQEPIGLFKFLELEEHLSDLLGKKVDLVSKKALKPRIGQRILAEAVYA